MADKNMYWTKELTPQKLWAVFFIQFNEGYQLNAILPFVVFMIRDFDFSEDVVGVYAGLLTATFALCQFLSSYFWGAISDKYGRKMSLLIGLLFSGFAFIIFGTSTTYLQAVLARCMAGIFNGNIGVARAYVADITNGSNRAFAFSIFAIAFSAGIVVGSTCGGTLIHTYEVDANGQHKKSVGVLEWSIFYTQFPYLLPCVIGTFISFFAFGFTMFSISDVDNNKHKNSKHNVKNYEISQTKSQSLPMVSMDGVSVEPSHRSRSASITKAKMESVTLNDLDIERLSHSIVDSNAMGTNAIYDGIKSLTSTEGECENLLSSQKTEDGEIKIDSLRSLFLKTRLIHGLIINATLMFMLIAWNALVPLLLAQILEMDSFAIGVYMAYNGVILFVFTWFIQPVLLRMFNHKSLYLSFGCGMLIVLLAFPSVTLVPNIKSLNIVPLVALMSFIGSFKFAFATNLFVISLCFVNNSVPPSAIGRANGLAQSLGAGLRGLGPLVGGALWSWSYTLYDDNPFAVYITYIFMWVPTAYSVLHTLCFIERNIQMTWTERKKLTAR